MAYEYEAVVCTGLRLIDITTRPGLMEARIHELVLLNHYNTQTESLSRDKQIDDVIFSESLNHQQTATTRHPEEFEEAERRCYHPSGCPGTAPAAGIGCTASAVDPEATRALQGRCPGCSPSLAETITYSAALILTDRNPAPLERESGPAGCQWGRAVQIGAIGLALG